eukprot:TRINITY_DN10991_c0_g1_i5.p1 TRINITY_DN10991_c0_g1~~TRINITY_DN10991_c0_g1_i5.p1  ORF type:complete len:103 (-),score=19.57 TRINITY_DN10991_c0_g1_i5:184-492(-)
MFEEGRKEEFVETWDRLISIRQRLGSSVHLHIEFYLMIYFSIFPIHPANEKEKNFELLKKRMSELNDYLTSKETELSSIPEFASFRLLPRIKNPEVLHKSKE